VSDGFEDALSNLRTSAEGDSAEKIIDQLRTSLREQLYFCLCLLDELEMLEQISETEGKQMDIREQLYSIAHHVTYHLGRM
jgi:hypothetical protein